MNCGILRVLGGFAVSMIGGHIIVWPLVEKFLWPRVNKGYRAAGTLFRPDGITCLTGLVERGLYTAALMAGAYQWIGVWLGIKVIARWQNNSPEKKGFEHGYDVWLIGSGISLLCAFIGAWIAKGQMPTLK